MDKINFYKNQIKGIIKSKLVIENPQSIHYAVNEIANLMNFCYYDGYDDGKRQEQKETTEEIRKNHRPIE